MLFIDIGIMLEVVVYVLFNYSNLCIVINNFNVVNMLMVKEDFCIIFVGGELCSCDGGIIGEVMFDFIFQFCFDFGILGISGIDSDGLLLEFDYYEVCIKCVIIENLCYVMLVVDYLKFGCNVMVNMGSISMVDVVYIDVQLLVSVMQVLMDYYI